MAANTIRDIVDYTLKFKEQPLNEDAVKQAKKLVLDTLGVSISGWKEPSIAKIYRAIDRGDSTWTAQAFGTGERLPLEWAIICNGALARVQDYMDVYYDLDASHRRNTYRSCSAAAMPWACQGSKRSEGSCWPMICRAGLPRICAAIETGGITQRWLPQSARRYSGCF